MAHHRVEGPRRVGGGNIDFADPLQRDAAATRARARATDPFGLGAFAGAHRTKFLVLFVAPHEGRTAPAAHDAGRVIFQYRTVSIAFLASAFEVIIRFEPGGPHGAVRDVVRPSFVIDRQSIESFRGKIAIAALGYSSSIRRTFGDVQSIAAERRDQIGIAAVIESRGVQVETGADEFPRLRLIDRRPFDDSHRVDRQDATESFHVRFAEHL